MNKNDRGAQGAESRMTLGRTRGRVRSNVALAELKPGEQGTVQCLLGSTQGRLRLMEMGMTPGVRIEVLRTAAFGGPIEVQIRGYHLSLRRDEAEAVWLGDTNA